MMKALHRLRATLQVTTKVPRSAASVRELALAADPFPLLRSCSVGTPALHLHSCNAKNAVNLDCGHKIRRIFLMRPTLALQKTTTKNVEDLKLFASNADAIVGYLEQVLNIFLLHLVADLRMLLGLARAPKPAMARVRQEIIPPWISQTKCRRRRSAAATKAVEV